MANLIAKIKKVFKKRFDVKGYYLSLLNESGLKELLHEGHSLDYIRRTNEDIYEVPFIQFRFQNNGPGSYIFFTPKGSPKLDQLGGTLIKKGSEFEFYTLLVVFFKKLEDEFDVVGSYDFDKVKKFVNEKMLLYGLRKELELRIGDAYAIESRASDHINSIYIPEMDSFCILNFDLDKNLDRPIYTVIDNSNFVINAKNQTLENIIDSLNNSEFYNLLSMSMYSNSEKQFPDGVKELRLNNFLQENEIKGVLHSLTKRSVIIKRGDPETLLIEEGTIIDIWVGSGYFIYQELSNNLTIMEEDLDTFMMKLSKSKGMKLNSYAYKIYGHFTLYYDL